MPTILTPYLASEKAATEPTLPKPCTTAAAFAGLQADGIHGAIDQVADAAPGRFPPPERAADADRFAGDNTRNSVAGMDGIGVHHPGHGLFVGAHVRRHDIDLFADERDHFLGVTAGQPFQFGEGEFARVAGDAALGAAVGQAGQRAFPAHPHGQRRHLAEAHIRMITQAALGRAERQMMLHPVAGEDLRPAIVHVHGQGDGHGTFRVFEAGAFIVRDLQPVRHQIELLARHAKRRMIVDFHGQILIQAAGMTIEFARRHYFSFEKTLTGRRGARMFWASPGLHAKMRPSGC